MPKGASPVFGTILNTLFWLALSAGVQWFALRKTREGRRSLRWLTLLPAILMALMAVLSLLGGYSSFYALFSALERKNALLAVFALLGLGMGAFSFLLLPRAILWLAGWCLGWGLDALERRIRRKGSTSLLPPGPAEGGSHEM